MYYRQTVPSRFSKPVSFFSFCFDINFEQFYCSFSHLLVFSFQKPNPDERETKWEDLQGFWDIVKIQIDSVDDMFAEIELMKQNGWQEVTRVVSRVE